jgi:hypothetical protein
VNSVYQGGNTDTQTKFGDDPSRTLSEIVRKPVFQAILAIKVNGA